jgi:hypothetical protein
MPVGLLDRLGGGSVAPYHHANKGRRGPRLALFAGQERRELSRRAGWQPLLLPSRVVQHGMEEMNPRSGMRLTHPQELSLQCLNGVLLHIGQDEEQRIRHRGYGRGLIRTVAAARARVSIKGVVCHVRQPGVFERRQEGGACWCSSSRHRPYTPGPLRHLFIAGHRHLRHWGLGRWAMIPDKP